MVTHSIVSSASRNAVLALLLWGSIATLGACVASDDPSAATDAEVETSERALDDLVALAARLQELTDLDSIRSVPGCYGLGHDLIFDHLGGDHSDALEALRRCHTDDLITNVYLFDETRPADRLTSLTGFIGFVENFALQQGYSSARNVPGNVRIERTGPSSARVLSSTASPHFLTNGAPSTSDRPTIDLVSARYVDTVRRGPDGVWRAVERDLIIQQIWRGEGSYPFAAP